MIRSPPHYRCSNTYLADATVYYYSEAELSVSSDGTAYNGNYRHYVNGIVTVWEKEN